MKRLAVSLVLCILAAVAGRATAQEEPALSTGQTLYLPIYSHLYYGDLDKAGKPGFATVSVHVSIRNTDARAPIKLLYARYYDTQGKLVREFVPAAQAIGPLGTIELFVPRADMAGGSGANFLIAWSADTPVNPPLVEALHADIREARGLVFLTGARPIRPR